MRDGNHRFFSKLKLLLFMAILSCFFMGQMVFAEGGDGTGGGQGKPLTLVSSSISNGATGVSLKPVIKLTFSKNIVNMSVRDNNLKCFSVISETGASVPINVTLADDQVDFAAKNDAVITPQANLAKGTSYSVVVSASLKSKSGVYTGKKIKITFTTEGTKPVTANNGSTAAVPKTSTPAAAAATPALSSYKLLLAGLVLMVIGGTSFILYKKRRKQH